MGEKTATGLNHTDGAAIASSQINHVTHIQSAAEAADSPLSLLRKTPTSQMPSTTPKDAAMPREWNTSKLGLRVGADALAAGTAGALVAPLITMIDKGIIENASGANTLGDSLRKSARELFLRPHRYLTGRPFLLVFVRRQHSI
jgi:hypothetical protein